MNVNLVGNKFLIPKGSNSGLIRTIKLKENSNIIRNMLRDAIQKNYSGRDIVVPTIGREVPHFPYKKLLLR